LYAKINEILDNHRKYIKNDKRIPNAPNPIATKKYPDTNFVIVPAVSRMNILFAFKIPSITKCETKVMDVRIRIPLPNHENFSKDPWFMLARIKNTKGIDVHVIIVSIINVFASMWDRWTDEFLRIGYSNPT
jgi:hypothetical protein